MSTDDVTERVNRPCPCGGGRLIVYSVMPDHPYARDGQETWQASITCPTCNESYALVEQITRRGLRVPLILVSAAELNDRRTMLQNFRDESVSFMKSMPVRAILNKLVTLLKEQRSVTAAHRILTDYRLCIDSESTFRKHYKKGRERTFVVRNTTIHNIQHIMNAMGIKEQSAHDAVMHIETVWKESHAPLTPIGEPVAEVRSWIDPLSYTQEQRWIYSYRIR